MLDCSFLLSYSIGYQGTDGAAGRGKEAPRSKELAGFTQELVTGVKGEPSSWLCQQTLDRKVLGSGTVHSSRGGRTQL